MSAKAETDAAVLESLDFSTEHRCQARIQTYRRHIQEEHVGTELVMLTCGCEFVMCESAYRFFKDVNLRRAGCPRHGNKAVLHLGRI